MLDRTELTEVVELQQRSYQLLLWVASAVTNGFIEFNTAHKYSNTADAAEVWISEHYENIPTKSRPKKETLRSFAKFFATYLENSFDLVGKPGKLLYSEDAHCFCPICSWLIDAPNLKPKKLTTKDKKRAVKMQISAIEFVALNSDLVVDERWIRVMLKERQFSEDAALVAYGLDLFSRQKGVANGPAVLALWRGFAWNQSGSPKHNFELTVDEILDAESRLKARILENRIR